MFLLGYQSSILKAPIPLIVGNVSLSTSNEDQYFYTYPYIVDDSDYIILFNFFSNKWELINTYNYFDSNYFPQLSSLSDGQEETFKMNGFVNADGGMPSFSNDDTTKTFHYNKYVHNWCFSNNTRIFNNGIYKMNFKDVSEIGYGNSGNASGTVSITSFVNNKPEFSPVENLVTLSSGTLSSLMVFSDSTSALIIPPDYSIERSDQSPRIISGEPCLGYYFEEDSEIPHVIGSICIGTEDLTTIPPIVGQNKIEKRDIRSGQLSGIFDEEAYIWIGTSFDGKWKLYQMNTSVFSEFGEWFEDYTYIITSGYISPLHAPQIWYYTPGDDDYQELFDYVKLNGKTLTFKAHPSGTNVQIKLVGLTSFNADQLKHPGTQESPKVETYIGTWLAPQTVWRNENVE